MSHRFVGIDHVQVAAPSGSEARARAFFADVLGMTEITKPASLSARGGVWFQCGAQQLHVGIDSRFSAATKAHPAIEVENLAALRACLQRAGIVITEDDTLAGVERFYVNDPFGNRLEFLAFTSRIPRKNSS